MPCSKRSSFTYVVCKLNTLIILNPISHLITIIYIYIFNTEAGSRKTGGRA